MKYLNEVKTELMLLGLISLILSQTSRWISEICVPSSVFTSQFYICSENDFDELGEGDVLVNQTQLAKSIFGSSTHTCSEVSYSCITS